MIKIAKFLTFILKTSLLTKLLDNFLIILIIKNNKIESSSCDSKASKINKILAKSKNIKKLSKIKNFIKSSFKTIYLSKL